jgi:hypothetical protein
MFGSEREFQKKVSNAARCGVIALALLTAACTQAPAPQSATPQTSTGSDDNGANCGGTPLNKQNCINNQNRMGTGATAP